MTGPRLVLATRNPHKVGRAAPDPGVRVAPPTIDLDSLSWSASTPSPTWLTWSSPA